MTLFELLHKVSFDDLIPTLKDVYDVEADIYAYREAFDELSLLHPTGNNERELRRNRAKRMRDARMERTIKRLRRMAKVEDCIRRLLSLSPDIERRSLEYLFDTYSITESNFRQQAGNGDYKPATLYESISKYSLIPQSEYDSVVIVLYSSTDGGVSRELRSSIEDLLLTGRSLKRSVMKVCSDSRITDGSIRAFVVTSKDER